MPEIAVERNKDTTLIVRTGENSLVARITTPIRYDDNLMARRLELGSGRRPDATV